MLKVARSEAQDFAEGSPHQPWLWLDGMVGTGKTHLAISIINRRIELGKASKFAVMPEMLDRWRASYGTANPESFDELYGQIANADCLVIDDLNPISLTDWAENKLFALLNHRYNHRMLTVVTSSGLVSKKLSDRWSGILSRLSDKDVVVRCLMTAPDYRRMRS